MLLSILIPTRNRKYELESLVRVLNNLLIETKSADKVEIIISNNSENNINNFDLPNLKIITPPKKFETAEEHLFFLIKEAKGNYLWPLGDDDIPIYRSFKKLLEICDVGQVEAMTWNSSIIGIHGEPIGHSRIFTETESTQLPYSDFLLKMGYWSIPAGISLTVFKNELNDNRKMKDIESLGAPIYSHVAYYASIFKNRNFKFINEPLVEYQTNRHDVVKKEIKHWKDYSLNQKTFYRYPWTLGMIRQIQYLESIDAIRKNYLDLALDISHFGKRFRIADQIVLMLFEQIMLEISNKKEVKITAQETAEIVEFISRSNPKYARYYESFLKIKNSPKMEHDLYNELESQQKFFIKHLNNFPFHAYYRSQRYGFLIYETPLGWIGIERNLDRLNSNITKTKNVEEWIMRDLNMSLIYALCGLTIPSNFKYFAENEINLIEILQNNGNSQNQNYLAFNIFSDASEFYGYTIHQNSSRARKIWQYLPLPLKKLIKRILF